MFLIFAGFMLFNFMTNLGPNAQTYLIAGEVFPTEIRAMGAGFAASFAKIGAVLTAFFFPILLDTIGTRILLYGLVVTSLIGAWVTWRFRIETAGADLETLGETDPSGLATEHGVTVRMARARAVATLGALFATAATPVRAAPALRADGAAHRDGLDVPLSAVSRMGRSVREAHPRRPHRRRGQRFGNRHRARAVAGSVRIGASDAFMDDEAFEAAPGIINVPLALSAWEVVYNVPALPKTAPFRLDGPALAAIYFRPGADVGRARHRGAQPGPHASTADDRAGQACRERFGRQAHLEPVPRRSTPSSDKLVGYQTTVPWPAVNGALDAATNDAMLHAIETHPYAIGYVGGRRVAEPPLGTATLKNAAGNFVVPERRRCSRPRPNSAAERQPDERLSFVFAPGRESYPLVSYEYAVVSTKQPDAAVSEALRNFLFWAIGLCNGNAGEYLDAAGLFALPESVRALSYAQIDSIGVLAR